MFNFPSPDRLVFVTVTQSQFAAPADFFIGKRVLSADRQGKWSLSTIVDAGYASDGSVSIMTDTGIWWNDRQFKAWFLDGNSYAEDTYAGYPAYRMWGTHMDDVPDDAFATEFTSSGWTAWVERAV